MTSFRQPLRFFDKFAGLVIGVAARSLLIVNERKTGRDRSVQRVPTEDGMMDIDMITSGAMPTRRAVLGGMGFIGASIATGCGVPLWAPTEPERDPKPKPEPEPARPPEPDWTAIERACRERIAAARDRDRQAVTDALTAFDNFFAYIRPRVGPMLDDLFDFGSTAKVLWYAGRDQFDSRRRLERYVGQFLAAYLYLPAGLDRAFAHFERSLNYQLRDHDQRLALDLEVELAPVVEYLDLAGDSTAWASYDTEQALRRDVTSGAVARSLIEAGTLRVDPGSHVVKGLRAVGRPLLTRLVPRLIATLGVRAGARTASGAALAGGAASSWWTAGLSLLASILISMLIESIINRVVRSQVEHRLTEGLEMMRREIRQSMATEAFRLIDDLYDRRLDQLEEALAKARSS